MPTVVIGNNTGDDYSGVEDTHIKESHATNNYGINSTYETTKYASSDHTHSLIRFSGLSSISGTVSVSSATLYQRLSAQDGSANAYTVTIRLLLRNWIEGTQSSNDRSNDSPYSCCYNEYGGGNSWTSAGALSNGNDRSSTSSGDFAVTGDYGYQSFSSAQFATDVENIINESISNHGWHQERTDAQNDERYKKFVSSEGTDGQRPYLTVTYTESGGATGHPTASRFRNMHRNNSVRYA